MLHFIVFCFVAALALGFEARRPEWSPVYTMRAEYYEPSADHHLPMQIWYDGVNSKTRRDAFGGTTQYCVEVYNEENKTSLITMTYPVTTEKHLNVRKCVSIQNVPDIDKYFSSILPDMSHFFYDGQEKMHGEDAFKWRNISQHGTTVRATEVVKELVVWVTYKKAGVVPLKIEAWTHDINHGTHLLHNYIDIFEFDTSDIDPETWNIGAGLQCGAFLLSSTKENQDITEKMMDLLSPIEKAKLFNEIDKEFTYFKAMYNIRYNTEEEHNRRREIFEANVRYINEHNNAGHSFKLAVNQFADRTREELATLCGRLPSSVPSKALPFPYTAEGIEQLSEEVPVQLDWRDYGAVTPVKDQLQCGSCWAFGAVGAVEGALFLNSGREKVVRLSEQTLIDCTWGYGNYGCEGGFEEQAYEWIMEHGLPTYDAYGGYLAVNGYCHIDNVTSFTKIKGYYQVTPNDEKALKVALLKHGPLSVAIDASSMAFNFYSHGVAYSDECSNDPRAANHAVLLVGYGILDGESYWLIKNSWGSSTWGNAGYIMMSTKNNNCGVMNMALFVTIY